MALMEMIAFDEDGNCLGGSLMDYLIPTAMEVPHFETGHTVTPSPHHPIGAKGSGESATVGSPPAVVNAVVDARSTAGWIPCRRGSCSATDCSAASARRA
jgi:aerobic carbon-monoxide dehydrogenase large subunit